MIRIKIGLIRLLLQIEEVAQAFYQINLRVLEDLNIIDFIVNSHLTILLDKELLKINKDLIVVLYPLVILTEDKPRAEIFKVDKLQAERNLQSLFRTNLVILILHLVISLHKI